MACIYLVVAPCLLPGVLGGGVPDADHREDASLLEGPHKRFRLESEMLTDSLQGLEMLDQSLAGHMSGGSETSQAMLRLDNVVLQEKLDYFS